MSTILVVEDQAIFRDLLATALQHHDYTAVTAREGGEALEVLARQAVDLILLDLVMPGMDGLTFLARLRATPAGRQMPVFVLTASMDRQCVAQAAQLGVKGYLLKGQFTLPDLLARMAKSLPQRAGSAALPWGHDAAPVSGPSRAVAAKTCGVATDPQVEEPGGICQTVAVQKVPLPEIRPQMVMVPAAQAEDRTPKRVGGPPKLLTRDATIARIEAISGAKTLAGVVAEIVGLSNSPRADVGDLVRTIKRDPVIAARVLQVANSAAYATHKVRISTVDEAARNIGLTNIRNIALSVGIIEAFPPDTADGFNALRCWQHSFAVAAILDNLPLDPDRISAGIAHLVGLCHDLGAIILRQNLAAEYQQVTAYHEQTGIPLAQLEAQAFGLSHEELTALALTKLGLPAAIVNPIREFHQLGPGPNTAELSPTARMLRIANAYAHGLLLAPTPEAPVMPLTQTELRQAALPETPLNYQQLRSEVLTTTSMLARFPSSDDDRLFRTMLPTRLLRIGYVRHPGLAPLDPLLTALQLLGRVAELKNFPHDLEELAGCDALVVAAPRAGTGPFALPELHRCRQLAGRLDLPVLQLLGKIDHAMAGQVAGMVTAEYPVSLACLDDFLRKVEGRVGA